MIGPDKRRPSICCIWKGRACVRFPVFWGPATRRFAKIIKQKGEPARIRRKDKIRIDPELLRRLYGECGGWMQRVHEKLVEEEKIPVAYPTLTRLLRELGHQHEPEGPVRPGCGRAWGRVPARHECLTS